MGLDQVVRLSSSSVECCAQCEMFSILLFYGLSTLIRVSCNTVASPQIRILDVATKASETRLIPSRVDYRNLYQPQFQSSPYPHRNRFQENERPLKSYVIYDEYPLKIFREWKANPPADFSSPAPEAFPDLKRHSNVDLAPDYYYQNGQQILPPPKPTLAYRSVYSNVIKVFDNSLDNTRRDRFPSDRYFKPFEGVWKPHIEYESVFPQGISHRKPLQNQKLPANFPKVFSPNENFHFSIVDEPFQPPRFFYPQEGFYETDTANYNQGNNQRHPDEVEILPEVNSNNQKRPFLCSFIRVNQRQFPENGPCGKSDDDVPVALLEYPDFSSFPNDKIPMEHRRQHFQMKRIKRSEWNETFDNRQKRDAGFGYSGWESPFGYESSGYEGYYSNNYPSRGYSRNRERSQSYRNRYSGRYDDYDDDYQNGDDSNSRGLTGYLTNGGRRYKNRKNNNEDDEDDEYDNENNRDEDSEEEMERMNSNRRENDRRNNDDSRDRRRNNNSNSNNNNNNNNNNNDDDDYRDNRRNRNSRRNNSNRRYNDRYDNNSRNRYNGNSNGYGYNNNGYGNSYLGYGSNYGGYGGGGYGSGSYGSSYGSNGGYGYGGGYGNFGSF